MIELSDVRAGYDGTETIHIDRFVLRPSEIVSIIGKNGSGKSTLLKTIDGQLRYQGSLLADGKEVSALRTKERAKMISYLPQQVLPVDMSVVTLISHGRFPFADFSHTLSAEDTAAVERAIAMVGLDAFREKKAADLSGGERTLAYLAMVIAQNSGYMLLDEPLADIDIPHKTEICRILQELKLGGTGILIASHDIPLSFSLSDKICVLDHGNIIAFGTPEELSRRKELMKTILGAYARPNEDRDALYRYSLYI
ncbi:MAG: ABC transporter ATP-binding protein [Solobacterium sp.]|nr:ABC transporter ATP-binding protein [Solobacterium sp.]